MRPGLKTSPCATSEVMPKSPALTAFLESMIVNDRREYMGASRVMFKMVPLGLATVDAFKQSPI